LFEQAATAIQNVSDQSKSAGQTPTMGQFVDAINNLNLATGSFTVKANGPYQDGSKSYLIFLTECKWGDSASTWESTDQIQAASSSFRQAIAGKDPSSTGIAFVVWDDSFDTYLQAAAIAKQAGFSVRWEPYAQDEDLEFACPSDDNDSGQTTWERPK